MQSFHAKQFMLKPEILAKARDYYNDVVEIAKIKKMERFLVTMDIEKAFDSFDHDFLISNLERYGFGKSSILWVKILSGDQESYVIKVVTVVQLQSISHLQEVPVKVTLSAFLFILALEILFVLIKSKLEIEKMKIFD